MSARGYFDQLNHDYLAVHRQKEDLFWSTYMGTSEDHDGFTRAEQIWKSFCADPARLPALRAALHEAEQQQDSALIQGLRG